MCMSTHYKALKEITKWDDNTPNHTYILNSQGHCVGFRSTKTKQYTEFKAPMKGFSKSHRKFVELKPATKYMRNG